MKTRSRIQRKRKFSVIGSVLGAFSLLAGFIFAVVVSSPGGDIQLPAAVAQEASLQAAAVTTTTACNSLLQLLNACPTTTTTAPSGSTTTTTAACNALLQLLNDCPTTTTAPPSTTTTTSPPTTTTTSNTGPTCQGTSPPVAAPSGSWTCAFDDEFDQDASLNPQFWQPQLTSTSGYTTGSSPNNPCYVNNPSTINFNNGALNLSVIPVATTSCSGAFSSGYQAGMITSYQLYNQQYGFFEVSAKLPASTVAGLQETLWLYPENLQANSGEIDYAEFFSSNPTLDIPTLHYPGQSSSTDPNYTSYSCSLNPANYNTYALLWTPTNLTVYYNGNVCISDNYSKLAPNSFNTPDMLSFTAALGVNLLGDSANAVTSATQTPATTSIQWVRTWQY
jgi:beta-glucanase (GH16 family)